MIGIPTSREKLSVGSESILHHLTFCMPTSLVHILMSVLLFFSMNQTYSASLH
jgi:hypothetical protein